jgi:membrane-associated phospholipid phosphatase
MTVAYGIVLAVLIGIIETDFTLTLAVFALNASVSVLAFFVLPGLRSRDGFVRFLGITLPLLVFYLFYRETDLVLSNADINWLDEQVAGFEISFWTRITPEQSAPLLGEFLAFSYMAYVPLLLGTATLLLGSKPQGNNSAASMIRQICIAWGICYILFLFIPVAGPRFAYENVQGARMGTGIFSALARLNQDHGMLHGAAFPSAHVAATVVATWSLRLTERKFFWVLLPMCIAVVVGAVYLGYHYFADVVAGAVVGVLAVISDSWWQRRPSDSRSP